MISQSCLKGCNEFQVEALASCRVALRGRKIDYTEECVYNQRPTDSDQLYILVKTQSLAIFIYVDQIDVISDKPILIMESQDYDNSKDLLDTFHDHLHEIISELP